ncbi:unnamed protein product [Coregonus sp. 'balchen']|nr:unnamed protein product [Coregonus sp. 'balchen']
MSLGQGGAPSGGSDPREGTEGDGDGRWSTQQGGAEEEVQSVRGSEGRKQYTPLGGVFYCDVFCLPPQSQQLNGWEMREPFPYHTDQSQIQGTQYTPLGGVFYCDVFCLPPQSQQLNGWEMREGCSRSPTTQTSPRSRGRWGPDLSPCLTLSCCWRTPRWPAGTLKAERKISFKMDTFYAFTLLQDSYANMPFQSWELRPLGQDSALLTITAALTETQERGLNHILGQWMSPSGLQKAMVSAGVNIFVNQYSDKYVSVNAKDPLIEHAVYEQMALLSSASAFSWSQWNTVWPGTSGATAAIPVPEWLCRINISQVCEHLDPVREDSWCVYLLGAQRNQRLRIKEHSEAFSPELDPGSEFHSTFLHMLRDSMSPTGQERHSPPVCRCRA